MKVDYNCKLLFSSDFYNQSWKKESVNKTMCKLDMGKKFLAHHNNNKHLKNKRYSYCLLSSEPRPVLDEKKQVFVSMWENHL